MREAELKLEVSAQSGLEELGSLVATLKQVLEDIPSLGLEIQKLLFCSGNLLKPGFIEFRCVPTGGASGLSVSLHVTDKLRELVAAAATGDLKSLGIN